MFRQNPSSFPQHDVHLGFCDTSRGQVPPQPLNDASRIHKGDGPVLKMRQIWQEIHNIYIYSDDNDNSNNANSDDKQ